MFYLLPDDIIIEILTYYIFRNDCVSCILLNKYINTMTKKYFHFIWNPHLLRSKNPKIYIRNNIISFNWIDIGYTFSNPKNNLSLYQQWKISNNAKEKYLKKKYL